jgi:EAL domain-containing protein (putative c-di-GMP-specific phosphodiesterase class I)
VRWNHPDWSGLGPDEFVEFAESNGLSLELTLWVFAHVVSDLAGAGALPDGFRVFINLAAPALDGCVFVEAVEAATREQPRLRQHVGFEVSESTAMDNVDRSLDTLARLRALGFSVAIDNYGTGHSSLACLNQLAVDLVKIDRSFVAGLPDDAGDRDVVDTLLRVLTQFGFATLAEGVETEGQAAWLLAHGCRFGQGSLVAQSLPFADLRAAVGSLATR